MKLFLRKRTYPHFSLKQYAEKRNRVLFVRQVGGLGDIFMHCFMFEDIKALHPDLVVVWAVPRQYRCVAEMHQFVDEVIEVGDVDLSEYVIYYNTTTACRDYETCTAPYSGKHRSDIWANHCGVYLRNHRLNLVLPEENVRNGQRLVRQVNPHERTTLLLAPISSSPMKDLTQEHLEAVANLARSRNLCLFATHTQPSPVLESLGIPMLTRLSIPDWMGVVQAADYVVSVDTSAVHYAGAIGKPTVGVFTYADGKVYGKYNPRFVLVQRHRDDGDWDCGPCYNWGACPKEKGLFKPCLTEISKKMLIEGINKMLEKYPV